MKYKNFRGVYVQAWVWINLDPGTYSTHQLREKAREKWEEEGECEIDENALISSSDDNVYEDEEVREYREEVG